MFTDMKTLLEIHKYALQEATKDWTIEQRKDLSKRAFKEVATQNYKKYGEYPVMKVEYICKEE